MSPAVQSQQQERNCPRCHCILSKSLYRENYAVPELPKENLSRQAKQIKNKDHKRKCNCGLPLPNHLQDQYLENDYDKRQRPSRFIESDSESVMLGCCKCCKCKPESNVVKNANDIIDYTPKSSFLKNLKQRSQMLQNAVGVPPEFNDCDCCHCSKTSLESQVDVEDFDYTDKRASSHSISYSCSSIASSNCSCTEVSIPSEKCICAGKDDVALSGSGSGDGSVSSSYKFKSKGKETAPARGSIQSKGSPLSRGGPQSKGSPQGKGSIQNKASPKAKSSLQAKRSSPSKVIAPAKGPPQGRENPLGKGIAQARGSASEKVNVAIKGIARGKSPPKAKDADQSKSRERSRSRSGSESNQSSDDEECICEGFCSCEEEIVPEPTPAPKKTKPKAKIPSCEQLKALEKKSAMLSKPCKPLEPTRKTPPKSTPKVTPKPSLKPTHKKPVDRSRPKSRTTSSRKPKVNRSASFMDFEASLKRPYQDSCERCFSTRLWSEGECKCNFFLAENQSQRNDLTTEYTPQCISERYASPPRSPVNKVDQRYDPNYRRALGAGDGRETKIKELMFTPPPRPIHRTEKRKPKSSGAKTRTPPSSDDRRKAEAQQKKKSRPASSPDKSTSKSPRGRASVSPKSRTPRKTVSISGLDPFVSSPVISKSGPKSFDANAFPFSSKKKGDKRGKKSESPIGTRRKEKESSKGRDSAECFSWLQEDSCGKEGCGCPGCSPPPIDKSSHCPCCRCLEQEIQKEVERNLRKDCRCKEQTGRQKYVVNERLFAEPVQSPKCNCMQDKRQLKGSPEPVPSSKCSCLQDKRPIRGSPEPVQSSKCNCLQEKRPEKTSRICHCPKTKGRPLPQPKSKTKSKQKPEPKSKHREKEEKTCTCDAFREMNSEGRRCPSPMQNCYFCMIQNKLKGDGKILIDDLRPRSRLNYSRGSKENRGNKNDSLLWSAPHRSDSMALGFQKGMQGKSGRCKSPRVGHF